MITDRTITDEQLSMIQCHGTARDRADRVKRPLCALCRKPVACFTVTLEPTRDDHYDVKFEAECCDCYEMVRIRGACCQETTALQVGTAFANHPDARHA